MIVSPPKAYALTDEWQQLEPYDEKRIGSIIQNQSVNATTVFVSDGAQPDTFRAIELQAGASLYEDILPGQGQIWARAATGTTATLTLILKYWSAP